MAPRPLSRLRRGRRLLGARGDGAQAAPESSRTRRRRARARSSVRRSRSTSSTRRSAASPSRASRTCSGSRKASSAIRRISSPRAHLLRAARRTGPTVLVFEDIHWADSALLDFIEYLLEWSRDVPLFVLTLSRPELHGPSADLGVPGSATSPRSSSSRCRAMRWKCCSPSRCPGSPDELGTRILERAEGVPFYAVETVRMLLDRGVLVREGHAYRLAGEIETLEVPETLQALIAARLDGLSVEERRSVAARVRARPDVHAAGSRVASGVPETDLEPILASLVRKEVVSLSADPLSPERGQYGFLQDLVKKVAYDTLSRKERKTLHLAAAAHLHSIGRRRGDRRGARRTLPRRLSCRSGRRGRERNPRSGAPHPRPRRGARCVTRSRRRGAARIRKGDRAFRGPARAGGPARARGLDGTCRRAAERSGGALRAGDRTLRGRRAPRTLRRVSQRGWPR